MKIKSYLVIVMILISILKSEVKAVSLVSYSPADLKSTVSQAEIIKHQYIFRKYADKSM